MLQLGREQGFGFHKGGSSRVGNMVVPMSRAVNTVCWYRGGSKVLAISLEKCLDNHHGTKKGNCVAKVSSAQPQKGEQLSGNAAYSLRLNF